jgi:heme-degrading monooxygenase HmoA
MAATKRAKTGTRRPAAKKAATKKAATKKATATKPATGNPAAKKPATKKPGKKPAARKPAVRRTRAARGTPPAGGRSARRAAGGPPIVRSWKGATRAEDADAYVAYLERTGFAEYRATPGNLGVMALRRTAGGRAEFLLLTLWESEAAIRRFAGDDIGRAVFYPEDERFLVARDEHTDHYELAWSSGWGRP